MVSQVEVVAGVGGVALGVGLAWVLWRSASRFVSGPDRANQWHQETVSLCTEALGLIQEFESDSTEVEHDELREGMQEMVRDLSRHAGTAVQLDVDENVITALRDASLACQELSEAEIKIGDATEWEDALHRATESVEYAREQATAHLRGT